MTGKTAGVNHEPGTIRPRPGAARPDTVALAQGFERLRDALLQRLEVLESIAAEHAALSDFTPSDREQILKERVSTLEASLSRLQAELKRRDQEWDEQILLLDEDRGLITEAWDRLEAEQIQGTGHSSEAARESAPVGHVPNGPAYRPPAPDESNDPVAKAILRQFQSLQGDVRRNANGRSNR